MITTEEALSNWNKHELGYYYLELEGGYEINLEPLIFDGQFYLAIYKDKDLVVPKVCMKPGFTKEE